MEERKEYGALTAYAKTHHHICVSTSVRQWQILPAASFPHSSSSLSVGCHHHGDALPLKQSTREINTEGPRVCICACKLFLKRSAQFTHRHLQPSQRCEKKKIYSQVNTINADNRWAMWPETYPRFYRKYLLLEHSVPLSVTSSTLFISHLSLSLSLSHTHAPRPKWATFFEKVNNMTQVSMKCLLLHTGWLARWKCCNVHLTCN